MTELRRLLPLCRRHYLVVYVEQSLLLGQITTSSQRRLTVSPRYTIVRRLLHRFSLLYNLVVDEYLLLLLCNGFPLIPRPQVPIFELDAFLQLDIEEVDLLLVHLRLLAHLLDLLVPQSQVPNASE